MHCGGLVAELLEVQQRWLAMQHMGYNVLHGYKMTRHHHAHNKSAWQERTPSLCAGCIACMKTVNAENHSINLADTYLSYQNTKYEKFKVRLSQHSRSKVHHLAV